jgi:nitrogen fixation/metabolism regulation signal transduction histidine kinase
MMVNFLEAVRPIVPNFSEANLLSLLNFGIKILTLELDNAGISVRVTRKREIPVVLADGNQIKQIFNLIKDSIESMTSEQDLKNDVASHDDFVILKFTKTSEEIPAERFGKVVEPFSLSQIGNRFGNVHCSTYFARS